MTRGPELPGYELRSVVGRGGFAVVYQAIQVAVGREVAVKIDSRVLTQERDRRRFVREVTAAGRLSGHPHVIDLYDAGMLPDGRPYLVMEYCPQGSLDGVLHGRGPLDAVTVRDIGAKLADALTAAHAQGVLHRDLKPGNILVNRYGMVGLSDFGLASILAQDDDQSATREALTPAYAAPEAFELAEPAPAADVYSLTASLYALLAGYPPRFPGDGRRPSLREIMQLHAQPVADLPHVEPQLMRVLHAGLQADPAQRIPTAQALRDALTHLEVAAAPQMIAQPTIAQPTIAQPTIAQPTIAQPTIAPQTIAPQTIAPQTIAQPTIAQPTIAQPTIAQPTIAQPTIARPAAAPEPPTQQWAPTPPTQQRGSGDLVAATSSGGAGGRSWTLLVSAAVVVVALGGLGLAGANWFGRATSAGPPGSGQTGPAATPSGTGAAGDAATSRAAGSSPATPAWDAGPSLSPVTGPGTGDFLTDGAAVRRALRVVQAKAGGGAPLRTTLLSVTGVAAGASLVVSVQQPRDHTAVDNYVVTFDGMVVGPNPASALLLLEPGQTVVTAAAVDRKVFVPDALPIDRLAALTARAIAASKVPGGRVRSWSVIMLKGRPIWSMTIEARSGTAHVLLDRNGKVTAVG